MWLRVIGAEAIVSCSNCHKNSGLGLHYYTIIITEIGLGVSGAGAIPKKKINIHVINLFRGRGEFYVF